MPEFVDPAESDAQRLADALHTGDVAALQACLRDRPQLVTAYIGSASEARTCLHVATDWPGGFPNVAASIDVLVAAGAQPDAPFIGAHAERPLHWAASSGDLAAATALIAAGASLDAPGGVLTGGAPLDDAVIFEMLDVARLLVERGASTKLFHAAALGLVDRIDALLAGGPPEQAEIDAALWHACRQGHVDAARRLIAAGADPDFEGFADTTTRQAAAAHGDRALDDLLRGR